MKDKKTVADVKIDESLIVQVMLTACGGALFGTVIVINSEHKHLVKRVGEFPVAQIVFEPDKAKAEALREEFIGTVFIPRLFTAEDAEILRADYILGITNGSDAENMKVIHDAHRVICISGQMAVATPTSTTESKEFVEWSRESMPIRMKLPPNAVISKGQDVPFEIVYIDNMASAVESLSDDDVDADLYDEDTFEDPDIPEECW